MRILALVLSWFIHILIHLLVYLFIHSLRTCLRIFSAPDSVQITEFSSHEICVTQVHNGVEWNR